VSAPQGTGKAPYLGTVIDARWWKRYRALTNELTRIPASRSGND
jgi:hypothetical protein